ncbi:MAG: hypothetical protein AB7U75_02180 [Hyphomicrobiaceae bacterium]
MSKVVPLMPDGQPSMLREEDVTIPRLKAVLDAAFLDCEINEYDHLMIWEGLPCSCGVFIDGDNKLITMFTIRELPDGTKDADRIINELNKPALVVQFFHDTQDVWGNYWMTYDGGLSIRQFVKMLRRFTCDFEYNLRDLAGEKL